MFETGLELFEKHFTQNVLFLLSGFKNLSNLFFKYGIGTEVPIKSLLGHRSQAPPEVRHVSGQHIKEFRDFLAKYPDDFVTNDEVQCNVIEKTLFNTIITVGSW